MKPSGTFSDITVFHRVLLHLFESQPRTPELSIPTELTQDGIASGVGASRNFISVILHQMVSQGIAQQKIAHVRGRGRRMKAYELSPLGYQQAAMLAEEIKLREIRMSVDGKPMVSKVGEMLVKAKPPRALLGFIKSIEAVDGGESAGGGREKSPAAGKAPATSSSEQWPLPPKNFNYIKKVCMLGDMAVGKTSLIRRFVVDQFDDRYVQTIGTKVTSKEMRIEGSDIAHSGTVRLMVWDLLGQPGYDTVRTTALLGSEGALVVCDQTRRETLENVPKWVSRYFQVCGDALLILLVNKHDLTEGASFSDREVKTVCGRLGIPYFFTSAKTGENVEEAFTAITDEMLRETGCIEEEKGEEQEHSPLVTLLDRVIDEYCDTHGGQTRAMRGIERAVLDAGLDIGAPSKDSMRQFMKILGVDERYENELNGCT
jgi:small GTP-binding protein